jgi:hypothetical protein
MENSNPMGMVGLPTIPKEQIPRVIGTQVHFIADGKIFVGAIRDASEGFEGFIVQCGTSMLKTVKYNQIIAVNPPREISCKYTLNVSVEIIREENRTSLSCISSTINEVNGVSFYNTNHVEKNWSNFNA